MPNAVDPPAEISAQLVRLMRLIASVKAQSASRAEHGLDWSAYAVLFHLNHYGPQRSKALAGRMHADPSTISRQVSALVEVGLVQRHRDPGDGRAALLATTPSGHDLFCAVRAQRDQMFETVLAEWSDVDRHQLSALLERFNTDFEQHITEKFHLVRLDPPAVPRSPTLQEST